MKGYKFSLTPRFSDFDSYGVVHHSNYLRYVEEARISFLKDIFNLNMNDLEKNDIRILVVNLNIKYKSGITDTGEIDIYTQCVAKASGKLLVNFSIETCNIRGISSGTVELVFINKEKKLYFTYPALIRNSILEAAKKYDSNILNLNEIDFKYF